MARYSSALDTEFDVHYKTMGEEYHDRAADYVDNIMVKQAGYDPDSVFAADGSDIPWTLKQIAIYRAKELFAQTKTESEGDFWDQQYEKARRERIHLERSFDKRQIIIGSIDYETGDSGGSGRRNFRV